MSEREMDKEKLELLEYLSCGSAANGLPPPAVYAWQSAAAAPAGQASSSLPWLRWQHHHHHHHQQRGAGAGARAARLTRVILILACASAFALFWPLCHSVASSPAAPPSQQQPAAARPASFALAILARVTSSTRSLLRSGETRAPYVPAPVDLEPAVAPFVDGDDERSPIAHGDEAYRHARRFDNVQNELERRFEEIGLGEAPILECPQLSFSHLRHRSGNEVKMASATDTDAGLSDQDDDDDETPLRTQRARRRGHEDLDDDERGKTLIALNLFNSEHVVPSLSLALLQLARYLGPRRVTVSIFENGSSDRTALALAHLAAALSALKVDHVVSSDPAPTDWAKVDRIEQLAVYRNVVLSPLVPSGLDDARFETVLFINDVFFCAADALELLFQRKAQDASAACGLDWIPTHRPQRPGAGAGAAPEDEGSRLPTLYDDWVLRARTGRTARPRFDPWRTAHRDGLAELFDDEREPATKARFDLARPIPVAACWNGMIALDAKPLSPSAPSSSSSSTTDGSDRGGHGSYESAPVSFRAAKTKNGECAASECSLLAKDFWRRGHDRFVLVPAVRTTYDAELYDDPQLSRFVAQNEQARQRFSASASSSASASLLSSHSSSNEPVLGEDERIDWDATEMPEEVQCYPWRPFPHVDFEWTSYWESFAPLP